MTALLTPHTGADPDRVAPAADPDHGPGSGASAAGSDQPADGGGRRPTRRPALPVVTTILSVRDVGPWLPQTLDALASQTRPPERLLVYVPTAECADLVREHAALAAAVPDLHITELTDTDGRMAGELTRVVPRALADLAQRTAADVTEGTAGPSEPGIRSGEEWLWLLTDATAPHPRALAELVGAVRRSPSVGVAGPKVLDWANPRRLLEVGQLVTRAGRAISWPAPGEPDQGQFDTRTDVLCVGLPAVLIRRGLFERIGGFEPALGVAAAAIDLGWRAQLAGERVVVVPAATVRDAGRYAADGTPRTDTIASRTAARVAARRVALARCGGWAVPLLSVWLIVSSLLSALGLLLLKRPAHALVELADLRALAHPIAAVQARWRFRRRRALRRRDLATLFVSWREAARLGLERVHDSLTPERRVEDPGSAAALGAVESGPVAEEAEDLTVLPASLPQRILTHAGVLATTAAGLVAGVGLVDSLRGGLLDARGDGFAGGELARVSTDAAGLWHAYRDGWQGAGLGSPDAAGPQVAVLAALTWLAERLPYVADGRSPASVVAAWVLLFAMPLATATAYLAGRVVTRAPWPRALAALVWGTSGVLAASVSSGRVTVVLAQIMLPLVAAGIARIARRDGTFTAAAATALGGAILGALIPVILVPVALAAFALVLVGPGLAARVRALTVLLVPVALQGPALLGWRDPATVLGAAGTLDAPGAAEVPVWQLALARPDALVDLTLFGPTVPALVAAGSLVPVLAAAALALVRSPGSRRQAVARAALVLLALAGLGYAVLARRVVLGSAPGAGSGTDLVPAVPWPGVGLQLYLFGVLAVALLGTVGMRAVLARGHATWRRSLAAIGLVVTTLGVGIGGVLVAGAGLDGRSDGIALGREPLPAVAVDQAHGPDATRLLVVTVREEQVDLEVVGAEPGRLLRRLEPPPSSPGAGSVTDPGYAPVVAALAAGQTGLSAPNDGRPAATARTTGDRLADLGVGFVSLRATGTPGEQVLTRTLDATPGLTRLGTTEGQTLWRVQTRTPAAGAADPTTPVPAARLRLVTGAGEALAAVPVTGPHGATVALLPAGAPGRLVVVAEAPEWAAHALVTIDGQPVSALAGAGPPAYPVPAAGGQLVITVPAERPRLLLAQAVMLALTVFLAIPFGNRRSRRLR